MANPFVHVELHTNDLDKAKRFYGDLFGWKLEDVPGDYPGGYTMIDVGEGTGGGMTSLHDPAGRPFWLSYVLVDDIEASTKKAESLGGTVVKGVTDASGFGWFSIISDPTGATLALWKPKPRS